MTSSHMAAYSDALVVLGTAGVVIPLVRRSGLSPVLGYLGAGVGYDLFGGRGLFAAASAVELVAIALLVATRTSSNPGIEAVPC